MLPRRFYVKMRIFGPFDLERPIWIGKQQASPGTALPSSFPFLSKLQTIGYSAKEDLVDPAGVDTVDETELRRAGLSPLEARAVIAALPTLP